ncbi:MAG: hypothetical protein PHV28_10280, partial [Kiritimatiellae bacterium]|nr:hypothetical protein [Kiritimatiellia bacterium]
GGYIVQKITKRADITDCEGKPLKHPYLPKETTYWEAWKVNQGSMMTIYGAAGTADDHYWMPSPGSCTKGSVTIVGEARYYDGLDVMQFHFLPNNPLTSAGILPATITNPVLPIDNVTDQVFHSIRLDWGCSNSEKKTKYHVDTSM